MATLKSTVQIAWSYGPKALSKRMYGRSFSLIDFHHLKIIKSGHWEYMGHTIRRMKREEYSWKKDKYLWVIERKKDGTRYIGESDFFSTKDSAKWRLYNDYITLARAVVDIEGIR